MNRLIQNLRRKKADTVTTEVPSKKKLGTSRRKKEEKARTISDNQFSRLIEAFVTNKEAIKQLTDTNTGYYTDLVEYTKAHGAKDAKGSMTMRVGNIVSTVLAIKPRELNIDKVHNFIQKLVKRSHLTKKEAKKIVYAEYSLTLKEDQYKRLEKYLQEEAVLVERTMKVNEEELQMLIPKGTASIDDVAKCYDELPEKIQFRPSRVKE